MRTADSILISLLAATDAVWLPSRERHGAKINHRVTNAYEARKRFREAGVPWSSNGTTDAGRKEIQRALEELKMSGDVIAAKPNGSKTLFAKLSDAAYDRARQRCGLPTRIAGYLMLRSLADYGVRSGTLMQDVWIPETRFNHDRGWGDGNQNELLDISQKFLPALVAGWLESQCDSNRRVYYRATDSGWQVLDSGWRPSVVAMTRDLDSELAYWIQLGGEGSKLAARTPENDGELGWLPLPDSHYGTPIAARSLT